MSKLTPKTSSDLRTRRHARIRAKVRGTAARPRLAVFRSNRFLYAQLIDDDAGVTLASASSQSLVGKSMMEGAVYVGKTIAQEGTAKGITNVVFDRGGFTYIGRIKALADAAREGGLTF